MIKAAESQGKRIGVQGKRYEGYMVWINALIASGGGQIITDADKGDQAVPTVASPAGDAAAEVIGTLARSSAAPTDLSNAGEEEARALFQGTTGSFMVNWPYVYTAAKGEVETGALDQSVVDDIAWARYPAMADGSTEQAAPRWDQPRHRQRSPDIPIRRWTRSSASLRSSTTPSTWSNPATRRPGPRRTTTRR